jgi:UDP-glucuronate 4-epimerase
MTIIVTGAAGFIGYHVCKALLDRGELVVGIDNITNYYDVCLKWARIGRLAEHRTFKHLNLDISALAPILALTTRRPKIDRIVHLAAQAGVRNSLSNPIAYVNANVTGHTVILELARRLPQFRHLVYASSSSVYGASTKLPFSTLDRIASPTSVYAATKQAGELISSAYSRVFQLPQTGLRLFSVYGPWGRPDMVMSLYTSAILEGRPIELFNNGDMKRDFTYIDDVVEGILAALDLIPVADSERPLHRLYNLGRNCPEEIVRLVALIEASCGRKAIRQLMPMQLGDVISTCAEIEDSRRDLRFAPRTPIEVGVPRFVEWYRNYYGV